MTADAVNRIRYAVSKAMPTKGSMPLFVALDGHSGAGKTTVASLLARDRNVAIVDGDDFYRVMPEAERAALSAEEGVDLYIDWQRLRAETLVPLREGRTARYLPYDWSADRLADDPVTVETGDVVIVEGVYSARPELADFVSLAILVNTPLEVCRARISARGEADDFWDERWLAAENVYFSTVRPPGSFDLIVDGQDGR